MSGDEGEAGLDKKIEPIVERALEKHIEKLREPPPPPTDPKHAKEGEPSRRSSTTPGKPLISPS